MRFRQMHIIDIEGEVRRMPRVSGFWLVNIPVNPLLRHANVELDNKWDSIRMTIALAVRPYNEWRIFNTIGPCVTVAGAVHSRGRHVLASPGHTARL